MFCDCAMCPRDQRGTVLRVAPSEYGTGSNTSAKGRVNLRGHIIEALLCDLQAVATMPEHRPKGKWAEERVVSMGKGRALGEETCWYQCIAFVAVPVLSFRFPDPAHQAIGFVLGRPCMLPPEESRRKRKLGKFRRPRNSLEGRVTRQRRAPRPWPTSP